MSDKPVAFLVTALIVGPMCAVCILGPAVVAGTLAGWFGWMGDFSASEIVAIFVAVAALVLGLTRRHRARTVDAVADDAGPPR